MLLSRLFEILVHLQRMSSSQYAYQNRQYLLFAFFSGCCVGVDHWFHFRGNPRHSSHPSTFRSSAFVACRYVSAPVDWRPSKAFSSGISLVCLLGCPNICKFNLDNIPKVPWQYYVKSVVVACIRYPVLLLSVDTTLLFYQIEP